MTETAHLACAFADNALMQQLVGPHNVNLLRLEQRLGVALHSRGNTIIVEGPVDQAARAEETLRSLYHRLEEGQTIEAGDVDGFARLAGSDGASAKELAIRTRKRHIIPRSGMQRAYLEALNAHDLVIAVGPAGTGKTYLAVAKAVAMKLAGEVDRIILSRPAVEAGERLGFLPGDMREKVDPYLRPLYDALFDMLPGDLVTRLLASGEIEVAPLAFMRGRTLASAFVILDEAQNTTPMQMKMFLTRLGEHSRMVVTGDLTQVDLPQGTRSGLADAIEILDGLKGVAVTRFTHRDVVRHDLVSRIVEAYDARDVKRRGKGKAAEAE